MGENPFVNRPQPVQEPGEPIAEPDVVLGEHIATAGPQRPLARRDDQGALPTLPITPSGAIAPLRVVGVHGGAGVTTLAGRLGPDTAADEGRQWPAKNPWLTDPMPASVLLCARAHGHGLTQLSEVMTAWHAGAYDGGLPLTGVCVIDDGPRLTPEQVTKIKAALAMAPHGWHMPWEDSLRLDPLEGPVSVRVRLMLTSIRRTAGKTGTHKEMNK